MNKTIGNLSAQMKTYIGLQAAIKKDDSYIDTLGAEIGLVKQRLSSSEKKNGGGIK